MNPYRSSHWKAFREQVIELDGGVCVRCGRSASADLILHVHHKQYVAGRKPWEYPFNQCETLCSGCHAAEHGKIRPAFGWKHIGYEDLGDVIGVCDYCGTNIRHVFLVQHENWMPMEVGEICCDKLTRTTLASEYMGGQRRYADRQCRFLSSPKWISDASGALEITYKKIDVKIVPDGNIFRINMNGFRGKTTHQSVLDAKKVAFAAIDDGSADAYFVKKKAR